MYEALQASIDNLEQSYLIAIVLHMEGVMMP